MLVCACSDEKGTLGGSKVLPTLQGSRFEECPLCFKNFDKRVLVNHAATCTGREAPK